MKKAFVYQVFAGIILLMLSGCPLLLQSALETDLVISLGRFDSTGGNKVLYGAIDGILYVPVTISDLNGKTVAGSSFPVTFTLSTDSVFETTGDNIVLGEVTINAGAEEITGLPIADTITAATYYLFATFSNKSVDTVTTNNTVYISAEIAAINQPYLEITIKGTGNDMGCYLPGAEGTLKYIIKNNGYAAVASGVSFDLILVVNIRGTSTEVGSINITLDDPLYPRELITGTMTFDMPSLAAIAADNGETEATFTEWLDTFTAMVDVNNTVNELDEEDNTDTWNIGSVAQKPNLDVVSVKITNDIGYVKTGDTLWCEVVIKNDGYAIASGYQVTLYADVDNSGTYNAGDTALYTWDSPPDVPFDPTGNDDGTVSLRVPDGQTFASVFDGEYYIRAVVTDLDDELDTTDDNSVNGESLSVLFVTDVNDIELVSMSTTLTEALDNESTGGIPVSLVIANNGLDDLTTDFQIHFYATSDANIDPGTDSDCGTLSVTDTIPAEDQITVSGTLTFPASQGHGFYTLYWVLDSGDSVVELDETNNTTTIVDECFVFFPVSTGTATDTISARLVAFKPRNDNYSVYLRADYYSPVWTYQSYSYGYTDDPGEMVFSYYNFNSLILAPETTVGMCFYGTNQSVTAGPVAYTFRFLPDYVSSLPLTALPTALTAEDSFEENDGAGTATDLSSGANNPLVQFVNAFTFYNFSNEYDYYTVNIP